MSRASFLLRYENEALFFIKNCYRELILYSKKYKQQIFRMGIIKVFYI